MKVTSPAAFAIPVCLLLFCWLTVGVSASVDNGVVALYGLPLAWYTPSLISSGGYEVAIGPMLVDLAVYGLFAYGLIAAARKWLSLDARSARIATLALWLASLGSVFLSITAFSSDSHITWWDLNSGVPPEARRSYFASLGIQPRSLMDRQK